MVKPRWPRPEMVDPPPAWPSGIASRQDEVLVALPLHHPRVEPMRDVKNVEKDVQFPLN